MDAGRLRDRVTIEQEARVSNGQGGFKTDWTQLAGPVAAEVIGMSGDEALRQGMERSATLYRVRIRMRAGVTTKNRLRWHAPGGDQVMAIKSALPDPKAPRAILVMTASVGLGS